MNLEGETCCYHKLQRRGGLIRASVWIVIECMALSVGGRSYKARQDAAMFLAN